jgi:hypothetical protein
MIPRRAPAPLAAIAIALVVSLAAAHRSDAPGSALVPGMRLTSGASETDTQPSWVIDSVALGVDAEGRRGCSRIHLRTRPGQPAPEMRLVCTAGDTLLAWRAADRAWRVQRPLAPRMALVLPQDDGGTVEVTSADTVRVSAGGRAFTALETTFLTKNSSGTPVRRLVERYVTALHTAAEGSFAVPDTANAGAWREVQRFRLVRVSP